MKEKKSLRKKTSPYANINWDKASVLFKRPLSESSTSGSFPTVSSILHIVAAAGVIGLMFAAPASAKNLAPFILGKRKYSGGKGRKILRQLAKQKYIHITDHPDGSSTVRITREGKIRALTYDVNSLHLIKPSQWDKKWRVVIFDISERNRKLRDIFRLRLRQLGLYLLQESVYVSPYKCFDEVEFLRELYGVPFAVKYLLVEKIEDDDALRARFDLE